MRTKLAFSLLGVLAAAACSAPAPQQSEPVRPNRSEISNPGTSAAVPMPATRRSHLVVVLGNRKVLVAGGGGTKSRALLSFDLTTHTWASEGWTDFPVSSATLMLDGKVLLAGATDARKESDSEPDWAASDVTWIYDPRTGTVADGPLMTVARKGARAALLADGKVLIAGGAGTAELYDPVQNSFTATGSPPWSNVDTLTAMASGKVLAISNYNASVYDPAQSQFVATGALRPWSGNTVGSGATVALADGRVLYVGGCPCGMPVNGYYTGSPVAQIYDPTGNGGVGAFTNLTGLLNARHGNTAVLLPSGNVLIAGGQANATSTELFNTTTNTFSGGPGMSSFRVRGSSTVLPSGEVLLLGGSDPNQLEDHPDIFVEPGAGSVGPTTVSPAMHPTVTLLRDGKVLIAGGVLYPGFTATNAAELLDPAASSTATGSLSVARRKHTADILPDGTVLVVGGNDGTIDLASTELYDPAAGTFSAGPAMEAPRSDHASVRLFDGKVFVVGGSAGATAEVFDPSTKLFTSLGAILPEPIPRPAAVQLRTGEVLVAGLANAYVVDLAAKKATPTGGYAGAGQDFPSLALLPDGSVLAMSHAGEVAQRYIPSQWSWVASGAYDEPWNSKMALLLLPGGNAFSAGGMLDTGYNMKPSSKEQVFSTLGNRGGGAFFNLGNMGMSRAEPSASLLSDGSVLITDSFYQTTNPTDRWSPRFEASRRPQLTQGPAALTPGQEQSLTGSRFVSLTQNSAPQLVWMPEGGSGYVVGTVLSFTDTSLQFRFEATPYRGMGRLYVSVAGLVSAGLAQELAPAALGMACANGAQCGSGFCTEGVCCESVCQGPCVACTVERKGTGTDGKCEAIPPEFSATDGCAIGLGGACTNAAQCVSQRCADGVCCDQECTGQCEACTVAGSIGHCVPVVGKPVGTRTACGTEQQGQPCTERTCDGQNRTACVGYVAEDVSCRAASCAAGTATFAANCDGKGGCPAATTKKCEPYVCAGDKCGDAPCETDAQCNEKFKCAIAPGAKKGDCVARTSLVCTDDHTLKSPDGTTKDCSPYVCDLEGCKTNCVSASDCVPGRVCDTSQANGVCVSVEAAGAPPAEESGCGCAMPGHSRPSWLLVLGGLALGIARLRRRS